MSVENVSAKWLPSTDVAVVQSDTPFRFALLKMTASQPIVLTESAATIWELLAENIEFDEILLRLGRIYATSTKEIRAFLVSFITTLEAEQYIYRTPDLF